MATGPTQRMCIVRPPMSRSARRSDEVDGSGDAGAAVESAVADAAGGSELKPVAGDVPVLPQPESIATSTIEPATR